MQNRLQPVCFSVFEATRRLSRVPTACRNKWAITPIQAQNHVFLTLSGALKVKGILMLGVAWGAARAPPADHLFNALARLGPKACVFDTYDAVLIRTCPSGGSPRAEAEAERGTSSSQDEEALASRIGSNSCVFLCLRRPRRHP